MIKDMKAQAENAIMEAKLRYSEGMIFCLTE